VRTNLPSINKNENYVVHLYDPSEKKGESRIKIDPKTVTQYMFELCTHRTNSAPGSERDKQKKRNQKHHLAGNAIAAGYNIVTRICCYM